MTISDAYELLSAEHRKYCIGEFKKLPSLRPAKRKDKSPNSKDVTPKDAAVLVPICRMADGSVGLLYTKRSPLLRYRKNFRTIWFLNSYIHYISDGLLNNLTDFSILEPMQEKLVFLAENVNLVKQSKKLL